MTRIVITVVCDAFTAFNFPQIIIVILLHKLHLNKFWKHLRNRSIDDNPGEREVHRIHCPYHRRRDTYVALLKIHWVTYNQTSLPST
jgi:hypothetical protein